MAPYYYEEEMILGILSGLASGFPSMLLGIAGYVLSALALQAISRRRGLNKTWLAWIPVVNCWLLGSLSDQYRYVVKGENKSKRKWLLVLNLILWACTLVMLVVAVVYLVNIANSAMYGAAEHQIMEEAFGMVLAILGVSVPVLAVSIAYTVVRYMALYDVYKSLDPSNCVVFLVLSILFSVTEPFFLFFNRNKEGGMPPRKQPQPTYAAYEPPQEYWEPENKDYL